jgi:pimeloyl-ACP methyl ester carboxylesterase
MCLFAPRAQASRRARALALLLSISTVLTACTTDRTRRGYLRENARHLAAPVHPVVIVPGFGVTRLLDPELDRFVWGTPRSTMRTSWPDDLDLPVDASTLTIGRDRLVPRGYVGSRGPINIAWQLSVGLRRAGGYVEGENLYPFAYDWRLSARDNAAHLDRFVRDIRAKHGGSRVDVVTHSAGALVALTWIKLGGGGDAVRHLVTIAPASDGVIDAFRVLVRPERFLRRAFDADTVATWPSVPELFPENGAIFIDASGRTVEGDLWNTDTWTRLAKHDRSLHPSFGASIARARALRRELRDTPLPANVQLHVLAGDCVATARRVLARGDGSYVFYPDELASSEQSLRPLLFEPGDGTVPLSSASSMQPPELFCDGHQDIAADPAVHRALIRILAEGR